MGCATLAAFCYCCLSEGRATTTRVRVASAGDRVDVGPIMVAVVDMDDVRVDEVLTARTQ